MTKPQLFVDGKELLISKRIGKGGEGEVFSIENMPGFAVKAYLPGLTQDREPKIKAMVSSQLCSSAPMVAFPEKIAVDGKGSFAGFLMRLIEKHKEIHELQTPSSRQRHFPKADYAFIVRVALNIARVFAQVHQTGCVVGDINQRSILVSPNATVALIDADSFQLTSGGAQFFCVVGVPEYTPPELQGKSLKAISRTTDHDAFGLAVCLFQLLCMDRHPFSGRFTGYGEMPLEKAISEFRFAYSSRATGMVPPPGTVRLNDFTPKVSELFERAFSANALGKRPSPSEWLSALKELEDALRTCNQNSLHKYSRTAKECPWCRMEKEYGRPLFLNTDITSINVPAAKLDAASGYIFDVASLLASLNGFALPSSISVPISFPAAYPSPSALGKEVAAKKRMAPIVKLSGAAIIAGSLYALASGVSGIFSLGIAGLGAWLLIRNSWSAVDLEQAHRKAENALSQRASEIQRSSPIERVLQKKAQALDIVEEAKQLSVVFGNVPNDYEKRRHQKQLDEYLVQNSIRGASIAKLTSGDVSQLNSYGIFSAFDAKRRDVQQVYGIGPVKAQNIAAWVKRVEARFQFQTAHSAEDIANIRKAQSEIITRQQGLEDKLKRTIGEFRQEVLSFERWKAVAYPDLNALALNLAQAEADLVYIGRSVRNRPTISPYSVPDVSTFRQPVRVVVPTPKSPHGVAHQVAQGSQGQTTKCPRCGASMVKRTARRGSGAGRSFWGCSNFPTCTATRPA